jgi:hypothetical protein
MKKTIIATLLLTLGTSTAAFAAPKYNAEIPDSIITPNAVKSSYLGDLNYTDGAPTEETYSKVQDFVQVSNAVRVFLSGIPVASIQGMLLGHESIGMKPNQTIGVSDNNLDANSLWLTANTTTPYITSEIDVKNGPVILEIPVPVLGLLDNAAFKFVDRIGVTHPDNTTKAGKYFIHHSSWEGEVPEGYIEIVSEGYQHWLLLRLVSSPDQMASNIEKLKKTTKLYPYGEEDKTEFKNLSGVDYNTIHAMNAEFYHEINSLIQYEPSEIFDAEWLSLAKDIGIEKGKKFAPDPRMQRILTEAAKIATAEARSTYFFPKKEMFRYEDRQWFTPLVTGHEFKDSNGVIDADMRATFHFMATGITPDMVTKTVGKGSDYLLATRDSKGEILDGSKHYTVTLPPNAPVEKFWSFMIYNNQTRSMLETDQKSAGIDGLSKNIKKNDDGSITIHFASTAPKGMEGNWVQTTEGKGFNIIYRMYSPTEAWFDNSWKPSDFVEVK